MWIRRGIRHVLKELSVQRSRILLIFTSLFDRSNLKENPISQKSSQLPNQNLLTFVHLIQMLSPRNQSDKQPHHIHHQMHALLQLTTKLSIIHKHHLLLSTQLREPYPKSAVFLYDFIPWSLIPQECSRWIPTWEWHRACEFPV